MNFGETSNSILTLLPYPYTNNKHADMVQIRTSKSVFRDKENGWNFNFRFSLHINVVADGESLRQNLHTVFPDVAVKK